MQLIVVDAVPQPDDRLDAVKAGWEAGECDCGSYDVVNVVKVHVEVRAGLHLQCIEVVVVPHELRCLVRLVVLADCVIGLGWRVAGGYQRLE